MSIINLKTIINLYELQASFLDVGESFQLQSAREEFYNLGDSGGHHIGHLPDQLRLHQIWSQVGHIALRKVKRIQPLLQMAVLHIWYVIGLVHSYYSFSGSPWTSIPVGVQVCPGMSIVLVQILPIPDSQL